MPEIPDLEAIRHYLMPRLEGLTVTRTEAPIPWLLRTGAEDFATIEGHRFGEIHRLGKFLLFFLDDARILVVNPMLTGRFHWVEASAKKTGRMGVIVGFDDGQSCATRTCVVWGAGTSSRRTTSRRSRRWRRLARTRSRSARMSSSHV